MVTQDEWQKFMMTDFKVYFDDCFLATEQQQAAVTQTGEVTQDLQDVILSTGVQQGSTARMNYLERMFNPRYGELYFKMRLNSMADVFMFAGMVTTLENPEWVKTLPQPSWAQHSFTGIMLHEGTPYFVTGNAIAKVPVVGLPRPKNTQVTPLPDIDMKRWLIYKIEWDKFSWYSLPYTVPYFDKDVLPGLKQGLIRKWSRVTQNSSAQPDDVVHYIVFFIRNTVGATKYINLQRINYAEVYPD